MSDTKKGTLMVLSGPSGVGKSTVIAELLGRRPDIHFSVSFTTRLPREGEVNGVNYHFVSRSEFERMIADGELLEYAEYVGNYYGTSRKVIEEMLSKGTDVLLDIEVQGAAKVREQLPDAVLTFLAPPSMEVLAQRLRSRCTDDEATIAKRLRRAVEECQRMDQYQFLVLNDTVQRAADELEAILNAETCRVSRRMAWMEDMLRQSTEG